MAKVKLNLDALDVETFVTAPPPLERGTVHGNACSDSTCNQKVCTCTYGVGPGNGTCDYSCDFPCEATNINCSAGGGTGGGGGTNSYEATCATGNQRDCYCYG
jgi:hypothetical protein